MLRMVPAASIAAVTQCLLRIVIEQYRILNADLQAVDKAQRQHLDNLRPEATEERQKELSKGANQALHALAPIYSLVILQHSTYKQVRHCIPSPSLTKCQGDKLELGSMQVPMLCCHQ